jgi:GH25 family lysozyme M1 (1,4-beta-N-acetylmuramidase)
MGDYKIIDISAWNSNVPYSTLKAKGIAGAILRVTEKGNKVDS